MPWFYVQLLRAIHASAKIIAQLLFVVMPAVIAACCMQKLHTKSRLK